MRLRLIAALLVATSLLAGCATAPEVGEPMSPSELKELARALTASRGEAAALRATGDGHMRVTGRTLKMSFALVYESPRWLRADLRPDLGALGASLTAQALLDGDCARLFFPARLLEVTGCLSDVAGAEGLDPASFLLGRPDLSYMERLANPSVRHRGTTLSVTGDLGDVSVTTDVDTERSVVTRISIASPEDERSLVVSYDGYGWKPSLAAPSEVKLVAMEGTDREVTIELWYDSMRATESVDREEYALEVPPGVLQVDWRELNVWR
jgi:hypothetical protein